MAVSRRCFLQAIPAALLVTVREAAAQPARRANHLGLLGVGSETAASSSVDVLLHRLQRLGWTVGQNLTLVARYANGNPAALGGLAADLVRERPDVIVAILNDAITAAKKATRSIPIVMMMATDPVAAGLVPSLARPQGNVTGTTVHTPELAGKVLEVMREAIPPARRVLVLTGDAAPPAYTEAAETAAQALGIRLQYVRARTSADVDTALALLVRDRPDVLYIGSVGVVSAHRQRIIAAALTHKIPTIAPASVLLARDGVLLTYGYHLDELADRTAAIVDKILRGASPAGIPVEQPKTFALAVNLRTATSIGVGLPRALVLRADHVIE